MQSEHIAATGVNTFGTTFELIARPMTNDDPRCNAIIKQVIESVMVAFPASAQQSIEDAVVSAIAAADGRFAQLNLLKVSGDVGNTAKLGTDAGIYVGQRIVSTAASAPAGATGSASIAVPFEDTNYIVSVEPSADPGAFRWWVTAKTINSVTVGFLAANAVSLNIYAKG